MCKSAGGWNGSGGRQSGQPFWGQGQTQARSTLLTLQHYKPQRPAWETTSSVQTQSQRRQRCVDAPMFLTAVFACRQCRACCGQHDVRVSASGTVLGRTLACHAPQAVHRLSAGSCCDYGSLNPLKKACLQQHRCVQPERMSIADKRSQILDVAAVGAVELARFNACLSDLAAEKAALSSRLCALGNRLDHILCAASGLELSPEVAAVLATAGHAQVQQDPAQAASWRPAACDADLTCAVQG